MILCVLADLCVSCKFILKKDTMCVVNLNLNAPLSTCCSPLLLPWRISRKFPSFFPNCFFFTLLLYLLMPVCDCVCVCVCVCVFAYVRTYLCIHDNVCMFVGVWLWVVGRNKRGSYTYLCVCSHVIYCPMKYHIYTYLNQ